MSITDHSLESDDRGQCSHPRADCVNRIIMDDIYVQGKF